MYRINKLGWVEVMASSGSQHIQGLKAITLLLDKSFRQPSRNWFSFDALDEISSVTVMIYEQSTIFCLVIFANYPSSPYPVTDTTSSMSTPVLLLCHYRPPIHNFLCRTSRNQLSNLLLIILRADWNTLAIPSLSVSLPHSWLRKTSKTW